MKRIVFNSRQKRWILFWWASVPTVGGWLSCSGYANFFSLSQTLLDISVPLLGTVVVTYSILFGLLNTSLIKRLKETNAFYSLNKNLYWLTISVFFGAVAGAILQHNNFQNPLASFVIDIVVLWWIAHIFILFWYAFTRLLRTMPYITHEKGDDNKNATVVDNSDKPSA